MNTLFRFVPIFAVLFLSACNLTVINEGGGIVTSSSGSINCGSDCIVSSSELANNTPANVEVLTATPNAGYEFVGWEGACSGTGICSVN